MKTINYDHTHRVLKNECSFRSLKNDGMRRPARERPSSFGTNSQRTPHVPDVIGFAAVFVREK